MSEFKDHFSVQSDHYKLYRPEYPETLFKYLSSLCDTHALVWDCATGNGQAARGLSPFFDQVYATDASESQIIEASGQENIKFKVAEAGHSGLKDGSVDLITVAQALHWFDLDKFYEEVDRVLKPSGVLAVWCYGLMTMNDALDKVFYKLYEDTVGPFWPPERRDIENGYKDLHFPYELINGPKFQIETDWTLEQLLGYLRSWSATTKYIAEYGEDPVTALSDEFASAWGDEEVIRMYWPLTLKIGRKG